MRRTDRLMAILIALQQKPATAQALADKFEVTKRTIMRDMQALSEMGVPLFATTGPTGGFQLMDGFQLPPLQLDFHEALTVMFALRTLERMSDTPFRYGRWTVVDKLKAILPEQTLSEIEPLLSVVEAEVPQRNVKTPHLSELMSHTAESRWIQVKYRSENHERWLKLLPRKIYAAHGFWYCEAYSVTHEAERTFRVDRMASVQALEEVDEFTRSLAQRTKTSVQQPSSTRIIAKLTYRGALLAEQDTHIGELVKQVGDESWELDFQCPVSEWEWVKQFFFTLGLNAEVIEPVTLRAEIAEMANRLRSQYANDN
ncbi:helix-turn-helix transcriptional regulator [Cohnella yongneupensis]|uniref:Helix-turn-helix transcriptional regulator n=1 Tax=Cohnella yongneupensis TaxID=425006 RepID=A0ABW0QZ96_9BACL